MHVPEAELEEDIEIIEVDESDLPGVLADEPFMTRFTYQLGSAIDKLRGKVFAEKESIAPPKLPPQFFKPPKPGLVSAAAPGTPGAMPPTKPGVHIAPSAEVPRRVRVIKRKRKGVRVSLIPAEDLAMLRINVSKRKWTMSVVSLVFATIILGGWFFLTQQVAAAKSELADVDGQLQEARTSIAQRLVLWKEYEDLQPRLVLLGEILNSHVVISRLFDFLEMRTLPSVVYRTATLNTTGQLTLDVIANSYDDAAGQLVAFEESDNVTRVSATQFSTRIDGSGDKARETVTFQLLLELDMTRLRGPLLVQESTPIDFQSSQSTTP